MAAVCFVHETRRTDDQRGVTGKRAGAVVMDDGDEGSCEHRRDQYSCSGWLRTVPVHGVRLVALPVEEVVVATRGRTVQTDVSVNGDGEYRITPLPPPPNRNYRLGFNLLHVYIV